MEKVKIYDVKKKTTRIKHFCAKAVTTNSFALNYDKSLPIYFFCEKRQANNNFLKDDESPVVKVPPQA